jgi:hypothetical protein
MISVAEEFLATRRVVANAKLREFRRQCWRLTALVEAGIASQQDAIDLLWEIAIAHALVRALGEDWVEGIIAEAFVDTEHIPCGAAKAVA